MDHFFQIHMVGPPEEPMLEAYTAPGFLAAQTQPLRAPGGDAQDRPADVER